MVCLLVGEGDFSYTVAVAAEMGPLNIVASCLQSSNPAVDTDENMEKLRAMGVRVLTDVDARRLHEHPWVVSHCAELKEIVFNFPHVGGKMNIGENRRLLRDFFVSAGLVLRRGSLVRLTLCRGQGGTPADLPLRRTGADTWQVLDMAAPGGFVLRSVEPFRPPPGYTPRGYRGGAKGFHIEGALTHVFCLVGSAVAALPSAASLQADQNLVASLLRSLMGSPENPLGRTVHHLATALGVESTRIVAPWATSDGSGESGTRWRCRMVSVPVCSPVQPPFGHVLDITVDKPGCRAILQDIGGDNFSSCPFIPATVSWDSDDSGTATTACWRIYCRSLHVATVRFSSQVCNGLSSDALTTSADISSFGCSLDDMFNNSYLGPAEGNETEWQLSIHVELLSLALNCLDDWRLLLSGHDQESGPLYPGTLYTHDLSMWLGEGFDEHVLFKLIYNAAGELLQSIRLVDDYTFTDSGRRSRCYRLVYQSLWKALSREAARDFHLALGRALTDVLPVQVR